MTVILETVILAFVAITLCLCIYFAPALIAGYRRHRNVTAIFLLNLLLGWTLLGWIIALIWAVLAQDDG